MDMQLYPNNEGAYQAVVRLLAEKRLVAVVHPTEEGKSFIAIKL